MAVDALNEAGPGGPCVLVTRPAAQATGWVSKLHARGCAARALPLLAIISALKTNSAGTWSL